MKDGRTDPPDRPPIPWRRGLLVAGRTFAVVMGSAGFGLLGGLSYGAWAASRAPAHDELSIVLAWAVNLVVWGAIGAVVGLAVGLLVMVLVWITRLVLRTRAS